MKKRNRYRVVALLLLVMGAVVWEGARAQGVFRWRAPVDTVRKEGFYLVVLTPPLVARCRADLADLRVVGPDGRFVSYVLKDSRANDSLENKWFTISGVVVSQKDSSDKHSYIDVRLPGWYEIDRLGFRVDDPVFYKRTAQVYAEGGKAGEWTSVATITLAPRQSLIGIPSVKTRRLTIDIANADNAPLVIRGLNCIQASRYLVAYLKPGAGYAVVAGNTQATAPEYDLGYFTDSLKTAPPVLMIGLVEPAAVANVQPAMPAAPAAPAAHTAQKDGWVLWSILLAILILLVYFTVRMVKAIRQKEQHDRI